MNPEDRDNWLLERRKGLGGSDVAALVLPREHLPGFLPSPWELWMDKHEGVTRDGQDNADTRRGRYLERAVLDWYEDEAGESLVRDVGLLVAEGEPWRRGTPDAVVPGKLVVEAKTARDEDGWGEDGSDQVPLYYLTQAIWYMPLVGVDRCDFAVFFVMSGRFARYTVHRDLGVERHIIGSAREWWERHVVGGEEPPISVSGSGAEVLLRRYPSSSGKVREATAEEVSLIAQRHEAYRNVKMAEAYLADIDAQLKAAIGDDEGISGEGVKATWKPQARQSIDTKALAAAHPEIAKQFTRTSTFRVLRVPNPKGEE